MIDYILIAIFIFLVYYFGHQWYQKGHRFPPGPSLFNLKAQSVLFRPKKHEALLELGKQYGPIYHIYFARQCIIVLNSYEAIKEALERKGDCFLERPHEYMFDWLHNNEGITFSHGENWRQQREFLDSTLNACGFGKSSVKSNEKKDADEIIMTEIEHAIDIIKHNKGKPMMLHHLLDRFVANILFTFLFDLRYDYDDVNVEKLLEYMDQFLETFTLFNPINFFPPVRFLSNGLKKFKKLAHFERHHFKVIIEDHDHTYHPEYHRNFVDVYLERIKRDKANKVADTTFTKENLLKLLECLYFGITPVTIFLRWFIKYMILYPEKQKEIHAELEKNFPRTDLINISDRPKIPYTEAAILETHRISGNPPFPICRLSTEDVKIFNYVIPKDTIVLPNLYAAHYDEKYWPNPKEFRPERFLDSQGNLQKNIVGLIPFSLGHRCCPAQPLSKNLLTLFVANLFHRFEFVTPENGTPPDLNSYSEGILLRPRPFIVSAKIRR